MPPANRLILASRSPRRLALLRDAGYRPTPVPSPWDDPADPGPDARQSPAAVAVDRARRKAQALLQPTDARLQPGDVLLAADTLGVHQDGEPFGTPETAAQARATLDRFVRQTHRVVTGVWLGRVGDSPTRAHAFADAADVAWGPIEPETLADYVTTDAWRGKAGGYNLAERQADGWPLTVVGDPATVMGLPLRRLPPLLADCGLDPHPDSDPEAHGP